MGTENDFNKIAPELLNKSGISRFSFFILMIVSATLGAVFFFKKADYPIDWNDHGIRLIFAFVAASCYLAIWIFVKKMTDAANTSG